MPRPAVALLALLVGCGDAASGAPDAAPPVDAAPPDGPDKAAACASTFGTGLTNAFGRLDGTVLAVVPPAHPTCALPNSDHLVLQLVSGGDVYRIVVNIDVLIDDVAAPLAGAPWTDGWHPGATLDYVTTLGVASSDFTPRTTPEAVAQITDALTLGAKVSAFGTSSGGAFAGSAHLIHRNDPGADGAIVIGPDTASPHYLLFRFATQSF